MPGEAPFAAHGFGVCGRELVVREDQVRPTALDVEAGADAVMSATGAMWDAELARKIKADD